MRYLLATLTLLSLFVSIPAFAGSTYCTLDGPHNCVEENEDQLVDVTRNTINHMQLTRPQHAFRTQNDVILEQAATHHAQLTNAGSQAEKNLWTKQ